MASFSRYKYVRVTPGRDGDSHHVVSTRQKSHDSVSGEGGRGRTRPNQHRTFLTSNPYSFVSGSFRGGSSKWIKKSDSAERTKEKSGVRPPASSTTTVAAAAIISAGAPQRQYWTAHSSNAPSTSTFNRNSISKTSPEQNKAWNLSGSINKRSDRKSSASRETTFKILSKYKLRRDSSASSWRRSSGEERLKRVGPYKLVRRGAQHAQNNNPPTAKHPTQHVSCRRALIHRKRLYNVNPYSYVKKRSRRESSSVPDAASVVSRFKLIRNKRRSANSPRSSSSGTPRFFVSKDGKRLKRLGPSFPDSGSPGGIGRRDTVRLLGATFHKQGNSYALDRRAQYKKKRVSVVLNRSRRYVNKRRLNVENRLCLFYNRYGRCSKGKDCRFVHDPDKVAVCTRFLRGTCKEAPCLFSHTINKDKMPLCAFFLRGLCIRENCPYIHVKHSDATKNCPAFLSGHCPKGRKCDKKHVFTVKKNKKPERAQPVAGRVTCGATHSVAERLKRNPRRYAEIPPPCDKGERIVVKKPRDFMDSLPEYIGFGSDSDDESGKGK